MRKVDRNIWFKTQIESAQKYEKHMKKFHKQHTQIMKIFDRLCLQYDWEDTNKIIRHKVMRGEY